MQRHTAALATALLLAAAPAAAQVCPDDPPLRIEKGAYGNSAFALTSAEGDQWFGNIRSVCEWQAALTASGVPYAPAVTLDWPGADPAEVAAALDAIASRVTDLEAAPDADDQTAAEVPYAPAVGADWTPDPDDVAAGLDQLAERLTDEEAATDDDVPEVGDFGAFNPAACPSDQWVNDITAGALVCAQPGFANLSGAATDAQIPDTITVDLAAVATTANAGDTATAFFSAGTIEPARLGSGTANTATFLRGDGAWSDTLTGGLTLGDDATLTTSDGAFTIAGGVDGLGIYFSEGSDTGLLWAPAAGSWLIQADTNSLELTSTYVRHDALFFEDGIISTQSGNVDIQLNPHGTGTVTTSTSFEGPLIGNATTATALAANGTNCGAGNFPLGVDAQGNVEDCTAAGGGAGNTFETIDTPAGTDPVADAVTDTLTLVAGAGITITGDSGADSVTIAATAGGIGGSTGALDNAVLAADGTGGATLQARDLTISDVAGASVTVATTPGNALAIAATAPDAAAGASQAGKSASLAASNATASTDTAGAAAGGAVTITSGAAARLTSGNANGGDITVTPGAGIGTGRRGESIFSVTSGNNVPSSQFGIRINDGSGNDGTFYIRSADVLGITTGQSNRVVEFNGTGGMLNLPSDIAVVWMSGGKTGAATGNDTGLARDAAGVARVTDGSTGTKDLKLARLIAAPHAVDCTDSGNGSPGALTLTPTSSRVHLTNLDAHGCDVTMGETGMTTGFSVEVIVVSSAGGTVNFADSAGVQETPAGGVAMGLWDVTALGYAVDRFVVSSFVDN